jgi:hypothetical protein
MTLVAQRFLLKSAKRRLMWMRAFFGLVLIASKKIRNSARDEDCTFRIAGVCNYDPATTVLCHLPDETKGIGKKSDDISAAYGCSNCHDAIDGRARNEEFEAHRDWYMRRAQVRTWRQLIDKGVIKIG